MLALCIGVPCCFFRRCLCWPTLGGARASTFRVLFRPVDLFPYLSDISVSAYLGMSDRWIPIWDSWWSLMFESVDTIRPV